MNTLSPDEALLGLLAARPQHGYQLLEAFHNPQQLGNIWKLSTSQLYAVLKRLQRDGLISGIEQISENAPPRVEYSLTEQGRVHLSAWLHDPEPSASIRHIRVEFLSRLYIAQLLQQPIQPIIARQRAVCQAELEWRLTRQDRVNDGVGRLAEDMVVTQLEAVLKWIEHCEGALHRNPG